METVRVYPSHRLWNLGRYVHMYVNVSGPLTGYFLYFLKITAGSKRIKARCSVS